MKYLSGEEVLIIHSEIIDQTGGMHGVRDAGLLISIIEKPKARFGGKELYNDVFKKAAAYLESFIHYHVFFDGNKRTGFAAAARFLYVNSFVFIADNKEVEDFILKVAKEKIDLEIIVAWFKKHSRKIKLK